MLFGHNTNVNVGDTTYHVQTEDRGAPTRSLTPPSIFHGRVLHRRTNNYFDLLLSIRTANKRSRGVSINNTVRHRRASGGKAALPLLRKPSPPGSKRFERCVRPESSHARSDQFKTWLAGKRATLDVSVQSRESGEALNHARIVARIEGAADSNEFKTETGIDGRALLEFEMPRIAGLEPALVIEAFHGAGTRQARAPRMPASSEMLDNQRRLQPRYARISNSSSARRRFRFRF